MSWFSAMGSFVGGAAVALFSGNQKPQKAALVHRVELCALMALYPLLPRETRFGLQQDGVILVQAPFNANDGFTQSDAPMGQWVSRKIHGNERKEILKFKQAITTFYENHGGHELCRKLLARTAVGLEQYAQYYETLLEGESYADILRQLSGTIQKHPSEKKEPLTIEEQELSDMVEQIEKVWVRHEAKSPYMAHLNSAVAFIKTVQSQRRGSVIRLEGNNES